jgi:outer membrane protein OmpA-like peptidoglycan-associated protein
MEDEAQLDQVTSLLVNRKLNFVTGEIDGYTSNVGDSQYNVRLPKRRANAFADYLRSKDLKKRPVHGAGIR